MMKTLFTICFALVLGAAFADDCAGGCCGGKAGVKPFNAKDAEFLTQANEMMMASEGKGGACCKAEAKVAHKAAKKGTHKLFVAGQYEMFCCPKMAGEARSKYAAKGIKVGMVQKVSSK